MQSSPGRGRIPRRPAHHQPGLQVFLRMVLTCLLIGASPPLVGSASVSGDEAPRTQGTVVGEQLTDPPGGLVRARVESAEFLASARRLLDSDPALAITEIYATFAANAGASGHPIRVTLSDFKTIVPQDYADLPWSAIAETPVAERIDVVRSYASAPWFDGKIVHYELSRRPAEDLGRHSADLSIIEVFVRSLESRHWQEVPVAVTTFNVALRLGREDLSYQATAFWQTAGEVAFEPQLEDPVLNGIEQLSLETATAVDDARWEELMGVPRVPDAPAQDR